LSKYKRPFLFALSHLLIGRRMFWSDSYHFYVLDTCVHKNSVEILQAVEVIFLSLGSRVALILQDKD
jgi:hypothetical protein